MINSHLLKLLFAILGTMLQLSFANAQKTTSPLDHCMKEASKKTYLSEVESAKGQCLEKFIPKTLEICINTSNLFQVKENSDNAKWNCLRNFRTQITTKSCEKIADSIGNTSLQARAWYYCLEEIKATPSDNECVSLSKKLYPADTLQTLKEFCKAEF